MLCSSETGIHSAARTRDPNSLTAGAGDKGDSAESRTLAKASEPPRTSPSGGRQSGDKGRQSKQPAAFAPSATATPAIFPAPSAGDTPVPFATIRAYRRTGCAIVTVERAGRAPHRHRISVRRYARLREWAITRATRRWRTSGWWGRSSIAVSLWEAQEARA